MRASLDKLYAVMTGRKVYGRANILPKDLACLYSTI